MVNYLLLIISCFFISVQADTVGSNNTVTRVGSSYYFTNNANSFPHKILGFTFMEKGFSLADATTTCTFDAMLPVSGNIVLNDGTLFLNQSLVFNNNAAFTTGGTLAGQTHGVEFSRDLTTINLTSTLTLIDAQMVFNSDVALVGVFQAQGASVLDARGHRINLADGEIVVASGATLTLCNMTLSHISGTKIRCADATAQIILHNVNWLQDGDVTFAQGSLQLERSVLFSGTSIFLYSSTEPIVVTADTQWQWDSNTTFSYDPASAADNLITFIDQSSVIILNGATWYIGFGGLQVKHGSMYITRNSVLDCDNGFGITCGTGVAEEDFSVKIFSGICLDVVSGLFNYNNVLPSSWIMDHVSSVLHLYQGVSLKLYQTLYLGVGIVACEQDATLIQVAPAMLIGSVKALGTFVSVTL